MPENIFHRIAGALTLAGGAPGGGSLRFRAHRTRDLTRLADGGPLALAVDGGVQLRLEGLDAPELHYRGASQPHGHVGRDELLAAVGVAHAAWKRDRVNAREATPAALAATILAAACACDPHGRPIAYFMADAARDDGTALRFSDALRLGIDRAGLSLDPCDTVCVAKRAGTHTSPRAAKRDASLSAADSPA